MSPLSIQHLIYIYIESYESKICWISIKKIDPIPVYYFYRHNVILKRNFTKPDPCYNVLLWTMIGVISYFVINKLRHLR